MSEKNISKADGEKQPFDSTKIRRSLQRAGVDEARIKKILARIKPGEERYHTTSEVYSHVYDLLGEYDFPQGRYGLKRAILELGPSGFPFEDYVAALFEEQGYSVAVGVIAEGKCVNHEIDVDARKDNIHALIECKFHHFKGSKSDIKVALYTHARYEDVIANHKIHESEVHELYLVTNTKCTSEAIAFARCKGFKIIGWGYPEQGNLQDLIEGPHLYPLTCLTTLTHQHKKALLDRRVVMVRDLDEQKLQSIGLNSEHIASVLEEAQRLLAYTKKATN